MFETYPSFKTWIRVEIYMYEIILVSGGQQRQRAIKTGGIGLEYNFLLDIDMEHYLRIITK